MNILLQIIGVAVCLTLLCGIAATPMTDFINKLKIKITPAPKSIINTYSAPSPAPVQLGMEPLDKLQAFIDNNKISDREYNSNHHCMHFSIALAKSLEAEGYNTGCVLKTNKSKGGGHMLVWVDLPEPYNRMYIEPILNTIHNDYIFVKPNYRIDEISINKAELLLSEQYDTF